MGNPRIDNWIDSQKRMVGPDAVCVTRVVLVGPDGDSWGTWAIDTPNLAHEIDDTMITQGEGLGTGTYPCKLLGLDSTGCQIALLHVRVAGRALAALGAGGEATALQRATGLMVNSFEQVLAALGNATTKLTEANDSLLEDRHLLIEVINTMQARNTEHELAVKDFERKQIREEKILALVEKAGGPALAQLAQGMIDSHAAERRRREEQERMKQAPFPPGWEEMAKAQQTQPKPGNGQTAPAVAAPPPPPAPEPEPAPVAPKSVQVQGFAQPADQAGTVEAPRDEPPPATPARDSPEQSPSGILPSDVRDEQSPDMPDLAGCKTPAGVEGSSTGGRQGGRRRRAAGGSRKSPKRDKRA